MKIAVIDNYDSFTYNLVHLLNSIDKIETDVFRNDMLDPVMLSGYDGIVLSPGPGIPDEAGLLKTIIEQYSGIIPIFGVCLGMQAIAEVFGAELTNLPSVYHGVETKIDLSAPLHRIFNGLPQTIIAGRYHSWIVSKSQLPGKLRVIAQDEEGSIMGLSHNDYDVCGVQFHPESILTPTGRRIMSNWLGVEIADDRSIDFLKKQ